MARRIVVLLASLAALGLLSGSRCDLRKQPLCPLVCEHGFKRDATGRSYCECLEGPACILIVPPPQLDPVRDRCVLFPTVCDVPAGWEPCGPGCRIDGGFVRVGETFPDSDGCNTCTCVREGVVACTEVACRACSYEGRTHTPGERFRTADGCNVCLCHGDGLVSCTQRSCPVCLEPEQLCERSGGVWDPTSCGHHPCGERPVCLAIIPGCDCGAGRSFREGVGCVKDPACGPQLCEPLSCESDDDCPQGSRCEGSSVCPPDVVCVWEGRPGICVPDGACCDLAKRPGTGGNPICFEGASCCADGVWACNAGDGSPTCAPGRVCAVR